MTDESFSDEQPESTQRGQGEDPLHGLLVDPHRVRGDLRLLNHAWKGKGPPAHHIEEIWNRLMMHLRTDACRRIDPESGMNIIDDKQGADISIKAAAQLQKMLKLYVDDEHFEQALQQQKEKAGLGGGDTVVNIGSIHMGQEPLTIDDAKSQAEAVLERFRANRRVIEVKAETSAPDTDLGSL